MRLSDINNKEISITLTDFELAKPLETGEPFIPINPKTNEPYFHSVFEENDAVWTGEWVVGEVKPIPNSEFGGSDDR